MSRSNTTLSLGLTLMVALLIAGLSRHFPFFWDSIQLGAMQGDWFYQDQFQSVLLPDRIDSGHIPFFGAYLAFCWQLLGQSLAVSHWAMVPGLWLLFWQMLRFAEFGNRRSEFGGRKLDIGGILLLLLWVVDPVLLGQAVMVSPDIFLAGAFLLAVNSILRGQRHWLAFGILLLGLISLRGMMLGLGLFAWHLILEWKSMPDQRLMGITRTLLPYLPGGLAALAYLCYHYAIKGWVGVHEDSPWAGSFSLSSLGELVRQGAVLGWRWLDYGRLLLWLGLLISLIYYWRNTKKLTLAVSKNELRPLLSLAIILAIVLGLPALISQGLSQHRYFLPLFLILSALVVQLLAALPKRTAWILYGLMIIGLASGNRWIYPDHIAQGWDATPAHIPYHEGRRQALDFLSEQNIHLNTVGTAFPEVGPIHYRELNEERNGMVHRQLDQQEYLFYSNIMNDFTNGELASISTDWRPIFNYSSWGVDVRIFQKNH